MKLLLGCFITGLRDLADNRQVFSGILPPLAETGGAFEPDYSLLLFAEQLTYDKHSYELLSQYKSDAVARIREALYVLHSEGFLEFVSYEDKIAGRQSDLEESVSVVSDLHDYWLEAIRQNVLKYRDLQPKLKAYFPDEFSSWDAEVYSVGNYLLKAHGSVKDRDARSITSMIMRRKFASMSKTERQIAQSVIREAIYYVQANLILSDEIQAFPFTWTTQEEFYKRMITVAAAKSKDQMVGQKANAARNFFDVAFPNYKPTSLKGWLSVLRDPRIKDLRQKIESAVVAGETIDKGFAVRELSGLAAAQAELDRRKSFLGYLADVGSYGAGSVGALVGGAMAIAAAPIVGSAIGSAAAVAAREGMSHFEAKQNLQRYSWTYFLTR